MPGFPRRTFTSTIALGLLVLVPAARAQTSDDTTLALALRASGHVSLIRHGATYPDQADTNVQMSDWPRIAKVVAH